MAKIPDFEFGELPPGVAKAIEGLEPGPTPLDTLGIAQNEVFSAYIRAGFREDQALYLTASFFIGNPGIAPGALP
jgi:hypothetical protein